MGKDGSDDPLGGVRTAGHICKRIKGGSDRLIDEFDSRHNLNRRQSGSCEKENKHSIDETNSGLPHTNGELTVGAQEEEERGQKRVLKHYVQEFVNRNDKDINEFVIIGYTSDINIAEELKAKMEQDTDFSGDIHIMQMGVSVGTHVGLGAISMFFVEKR